MKEFPSLREFLLLKDYEGRSVWQGRCITAEGLVSRYDDAKISWETYGDEPPFGSEVWTLFPGHGGPAGMVKTLVGFYEEEQYGRKYYHLVDRYDGHSSISDVDRWWMEFTVVVTAE